jgi:hypothetical protein
MLMLEDGWQRPLDAILGWLARVAPR